MLPCRRLELFQEVPRVKSLQFKLLRSLENPRNLAKARNRIRRAEAGVRATKPRANVRRVPKRDHSLRLKEGFQIWTQHLDNNRLSHISTQTLEVINRSLQLQLPPLIKEAFILTNL